MPSMEIINCNRELIRLIEKHPTIWDKTSETYRNKELKNVAWNIICSDLSDEYNKMRPRQQQEFEKSVLKKWTHLRDSWMKSYKKNTTPYSKAKYIRPYRYHNQMVFLIKVADMTPRRKPRTTNNVVKKSELKYEESSAEDEANEFDENDEYAEEAEEEQELNDSKLFDKRKTEVQETEEEEYVEEEDLEESTIVEDANWTNQFEEMWTNETDEKFLVAHGENSPNKITTFKRRKRPAEVSTEALAESVKASSQNRSIQSNNSMSESENNRHVSFFRSLLPSLATLDDDQTLQFQAGTINLLQRIKRIVKNGSTHYVVSEELDE